jgi:cyclin B
MFTSNVRVYQDCDLHLIGVGSMFLASKIEDIYHVPLQDMVKRVSHNKFSANAIKSIENEIVGAHLFNIYFPTHLNYLSFYFFKCFSISDK